MGPTHQHGQLKAAKRDDDHECDRALGACLFSATPLLHIRLAVQRSLDAGALP